MICNKIDKLKRKHLLIDQKKKHLPTCPSHNPDALCQTQSVDVQKRNDTPQVSEINTSMINSFCSLHTHAHTHTLIKHTHTHTCRWEKQIRKLTFQIKTSRGRRDEMREQSVKVSGEGGGEPPWGGGGVT